MGVHGLWKLIDSSGKAIPLEALENRVLAVDVSIWLYQLVKGFQESAGHSVANAYLLGLFHRICKLLFYRIKPVFVFDGGVPSLKRKTIAARQNNRAKASFMGEKLRQTLLENLAKQEALGKALGESVVLPKLFQPKQDSLFSLPPLPESEEVEYNSDEEKKKVKGRYKDLQSIDITSEEFLSLPADMRHDILTELKETRKQNSWAKLHLMPEVGDDFSDFQMRRLLKRRAIQVGIEKAEGEMGTRGFTISDLQTILSDQGVDLAQRIAADNSTRLLYHNKLSKGISSESSGQKMKSEKKTDTILMESFDSIINSEEDSCSSEDETSEKSLTQAEILEIIKQENSSSKIEDKKDLPASGSSLTSSQQESVKTEEEPKLTVNGRAVENESENNANKLEHETLPQENRNHYQLSSPPTIPQISPQSQSPTSSEMFSSSSLENSGVHNIVESGSADLADDSSTIKNVKENICQQTNDFYSNERMKFAANDGVSAETQEVFEKQEVFQSELPESSTSNKPDKKEQPSNFENYCSSEESDEDFIEVSINENIEEEIQENAELDLKNKSPSPPKDFDLRKEDKKGHDKTLEIVFNSADTLENDLFADIFENNSISNCSENSQSTQATISLSNKSVSPLKTITSEEKEFAMSIEHDIQESTIDSLTPNKSDDKKPPSPVPQLSINEIIKMKKDLEHESSYLMKETSREDRIASTITEQIRLDAQELLQLFGIPYVTAPLEAEAQCAFLDLTGQTQGTITDDSDIWLFGGNNVYKNFFDQKKFVQQFKATDIVRCLHVGREEMIMLALLSGSDYTLGLTGVGAVTALEVIAHYPKTTNESSPTERLKRFAKEFNTKSLGGSIARKLKKASLTEGFPSAEVVQAYLDPAVDKSTEAFSWSKPNVNEIRRYAREKFGWDQTKTDKVLEPVLENLKRTQTQGTLHRYFDWKFDHLENTRSKRVENALNLLKEPSLLTAPSTSTARPPIRGNKKYAQESNADLPLKSKTPAQIARERAAKKFKELKKQGKIGPKSKK